MWYKKTITWRIFMTSPSSIRILFAATALSLASGAVCAQTSLNLTNSGTLAGNLSTEGVRSYNPTTATAKGKGTTKSGETPGATVGTRPSNSVDSSIGTSTGSNPSGESNTTTGSSNTTTGGGKTGFGSGGTDSNGLGDFVGPPNLTGLNDSFGGMACLPGMSDCGSGTGAIGSVIGSTGINPGAIGSVINGTGVTNGIDWNTLIQIGAPLIGAASGNQTAAQIGSLIGSGANLLQNGSLIPNENWTASQWANLANMGIQVGAAANKNNSDWQTAASVATAGTTVLNGYNASNNSRQSQLTQIGVSSTGQPIYQQTTTGGAYSGQTTYGTATGVAQSVLQAGQTPGINGNAIYTADTGRVSNQVGQVVGNTASGLYSSTPMSGLLGTVGTASSPYVNNQVGQLTGNSTLPGLIGSGVSSAANQIGQTFTTKPLAVETETVNTKPLQVQIDDTMYDWIP